MEDSDYCTLTEDTSPSDGVAGTVLLIQMKNFMCHDNLEVRLNPRINFVVGKNGSGKSAIQTAIAIGLGGKALATNRGSNMKALIKNDKNQCTIRIVLSNQGPMAYQPQLYGSSIQVERTISQSTSGYKIKSHSGQTVSCEKKELERILHQFNIQTDNPICILHQDTSRNFLNSSDPKNKYKFYKKATRFDEITRIYAECINRVTTNKEQVQSKAEIVNETFKDVIEMGKKLELFRGAEEKAMRKNKLEIELIWASIKEKNNALEELNKKKGAEQITMSKAERRLREKDEDSIKEKIRELEKKLKELDESVKDARDKLQPARENLKKKNEEKNNTSAEFEEAKQSATQTKRQYEHCQRELENLTKNAAEIKQRQECIQKEIEKFENEVIRLTSTEELVSLEVQQLRDTLDNHRANLQNKNQRLNELQRQLNNRNDQIRRLSESSNSLSIYGPNIVKVVQEIERATQQRRFQKTPIGPIGKYIKVRDPNWAGAIENFLKKGFLSSFCVDNGRDAKVLTELFKKVYAGQSDSQPSIITSRFLDRVHNFKPSETGNQRYSSLASVLEFDNPVVANCLIDQSEIETVLLIPTNEEAYQIMGEQHKVPRNCKRAFTLTGDLFIPAPNYKSYSSMRPVTQASLLHARQEDVIRSLRNEVNQLNNDTCVLKEEIDEIEKEINKIVGYVDKKEKELKKLKHEKNKCMQKQAELRETLETEGSTNVEYFADESRELKKKYDETYKKYQDLKVKKEEMLEKVKEAKDKYEALSKIIAESDEEKAPIRAEIQRLQSSMREATDRAAGLRQKIQEHMRNLDELNETIETLTQKITENTENASQISEPVNTRRSCDEITAEIKKIELYLKRLEEESHGNMEEIQRRYNERKATFNAVNSTLNVLIDFFNRNQKILKERTGSTKRVEACISISAKHNFTLYLNERNFEGKLEFQPEKESLVIKVRPVKDKSIQRLEGQMDTSSLSGGEKSFSTVCFIMALWQEVQLPFHFLDEFDVFMDSINRRIVMDLLIAYAKKVNQQFVFLTPLDMSSVKVDELITVHRLEPPRK